MSGLIPKCIERKCKHFGAFYSRSGGKVDRAKWEEMNRHGLAGCDCAAFPNGIPKEIAFGDNPHTDPYPGDNGIQYEPNDE